LTEREQIQSARIFSRDWAGHGDEMQETYNFWYALFRDIFGIEKPEKIFKFQEPVKFDGRTHNIDLLIPKTKVLIEQKKFGVDLSKKYPQSDLKFLTPYEQAKRYAENLPHIQQPRWIVTCNFSEFRIYDFEWINHPFVKFIEATAKSAKDKTIIEEYLRNTEHFPTVIKLEDLHKEYKRLNILIDPEAEVLPEVKLASAAIDTIKTIHHYFGIAYEKILPENDYRDFLNKLCVRLVFCFYAGDAQIFDSNQFRDYLQNIELEKRHEALNKLFDVLDIPEAERPENLSEELKKFPYVNGGLFDDKIEIPTFDSNIYYHTAMAADAEVFSQAKKYDWSLINPTIFGAMFESTLNPLTQREGGMHYTSVENIHKVIDPLFMDDLYAEFDMIKRKTKKNRYAALQNFQDKLSTLTFLDPACGSGNFLTETFLSLRKLENKVLRELKKNVNADLFSENPVKVSISQFYGIEINDFAVSVAQVALWIAENQMLQETEKIIAKDLDQLPLKSYPNIFKKNALQIDWKEIILPDKLKFIIGNPPFVGAMKMNVEQKNDMHNIWGNTRGVGEMDYICAWYKKAFEFISDTNIEVAFVSTNSISQGQQSITVLKSLMDAGLKINFAHQTFKWFSESANMAAVHCVIISFAKFDRKEKYIFQDDKKFSVTQINSYLKDESQIFVEYRANPLCNVPQMFFGSMPRDGKNFILSEIEREIFIKENPQSEKFIKLYLGADEFLNGKQRYCLWLADCSDDELKQMPLVVKRIQAVKNFRLASKAEATRKFAKTPKVFCQIAQPKTNYLLIPRVSSENRKYIPMAFFNSNVIASDATLIIPNATIYHFGILESSVHMAWTRAICGRLKSDYRYSKDIVYNNFVWCEESAENVEKISATAEKILSVRKNFSDKTLAWLYNEKTMPAELRAAHLENDFAVLEAYGFDKNLSEEDIVSALMILYKNLTEKL